MFVYRNLLPFDFIKFNESGLKITDQCDAELVRLVFPLPLPCVKVPKATKILDILYRIHLLLNPMATNGVPGRTSHIFKRNLLLYETQTR